MPALVIHAIRLDLQRGVTFNNAFLVVQCPATELEVNLPACHLAAYITAVIKTAADDLDRPFGVQPAIAVVEGAGGDVGVAGLRGDAAAVVVEAGTGEDQALGLMMPA